MPFEAILHSVSYAGVWPGQARLSLPDFLRKAKALGFPSVMLMAKRPHLSLLDYPEARRLALREEMEKLGVRCAVLAGYNNFSGDAEHPDIPQREMQTVYITELAKAARDVGAKVVRIFTAYDHASLPHAQLWSVLVPALRECAERAAEYGVTLAVQNHHDCAGHHRMFRDLLEAVGHPQCRAAFDAWAPALQDDDLVEAAAALAPFTVHTTAADYQRRPRFQYNPAMINYEPRTPWVQAVPMGDGFIDYAAFLGTLRAGGYPGGVAYEMCSPLQGGGSEENLDGYARQFLEWLRQLG